MSAAVFGDLDGLLTHADSKFTLVNIVAKRARQLTNGAPPLTDRVDVNKAVSTAFNEVSDGKIGYRRPNEPVSHAARGKDKDAPRRVRASRAVKLAQPLVEGEDQQVDAGETSGSTGVLVGGGSD
jgi:DNA-directed RNA polymerase subunit omega